MDSQPELEQSRHEFFSRFKEGRRIRRHRGDGGEGFIRSHIFRVQQQKGEISSRLCSLPTKAGQQRPRLGLSRWSVDASKLGRDQRAKRAGRRSFSSRKLGRIEQVQPVILTLFIIAENGRLEKTNDYPSLFSAKLLDDSRVEHNVIGTFQN